jgi:hypothetical protein
MSPGCDVFLDFPCFWSPWQIWAVLLKYFRDCSSIWLCQISFPWWNRIYGFGRGKSEKTSTMLITYQEYIWSMWLINADVNLDLWAEVVFYRVGFFFFFTVMLLSPCFPHYFLEEVTMHRLYLRRRELCSIYLKTGCQHKLSGILLYRKLSIFLIYSILTYLFISCGYSFYALSYKFGL